MSVLCLNNAEKSSLPPLLNYCPTHWKLHQQKSTAAKNIHQTLKLLQQSFGRKV